MIVADTNVWSESLRPAPDERVLEWLAHHSPQLAMTTITVGELLYGVGLLPDGRRRRTLTAAIETMLVTAGPRILDYDRSAARAYARLRAVRSSTGRPVSAEDMMIAAICSSGGHAVATRNLRDFDGVGIDLIDPWTDE